MATAKEVLDRVFSKARVKRAGVSLTDEDYNIGIDVMNDWFTQLASIGISLRYTRVSKQGDEVTVQDWALKVLKSNLTVLIAGEYDKTINAVMIGEASGDYKLMLQRKVTLDETYFPDTLPTGSGNNPDNQTGSGNFFPDRDFNDALSASGQSIQNERGEQMKINKSEQE